VNDDVKNQNNMLLSLVFIFAPLTLFSV